MCTHYAQKRTTCRKWWWWIDACTGPGANSRPFYVGMCCWEKWKLTHSFTKFWLKIGRMYLLLIKKIGDFEKCFHLFTKDYGSKRGKGVMAHLQYLMSTEYPPPPPSAHRVMGLFFTWFSDVKSRRHRVELTVVLTNIEAKLEWSNQEWLLGSVSADWF